MYHAREFIFFGVVVSFSSATNDKRKEKENKNFHKTYFRDIKRFTLYVI